MNIEIYKRASNNISNLENMDIMFLIDDYFRLLYRFTPNKKKFPDQIMWEFVKDKIVVDEGQDNTEEKLERLFSINMILFKKKYDNLLCPFCFKTYHRNALPKCSKCEIPVCSKNCAYKKRPYYSYCKTQYCKNCYEKYNPELY